MTPEEIRARADAALHRNNPFGAGHDFSPAAPSPSGTTESAPAARHPGSPTREDRAVAAGFVRRARAAGSWDEHDATVDAIAQDIADERALATSPPVPDGPWRVGGSWGVHVYQGEKGAPGEQAVASFLGDPETARANAMRAVAAVNALLTALGGGEQ